MQFVIDNSLIIGFVIGVVSTIIVMYIYRHYELKPREKDDF